MWWRTKPNVEIELLTSRLKAAEDAHVKLLNAFNAFFDVVAKDLGYETARDFWYQWGANGESDSSPRRVAEDVVPETRTIKRTKPARAE